MTLTVTGLTGNFGIEKRMESAQRIASGRFRMQGKLEVAHEVLKGRTVLLIEDSWLIAQGYKSMLELSGMEVIGPAANVADAEELLLSHVPELALVDINLQGSDSYELIAALVERNIPVVIISGNEVSPEVAASVDCVLTKPIGGATLMSTLRRVAAARDFK